MRYLISICVVSVLAAACNREQPVTPNHPPAKKAAEARKKGAAKKAEEDAGVGSAVGSLMPPYSTLWLSGKPFDIAAEKGNVVLLNLWATWCGPCRAEVPVLKELHGKYAAQHFKVIGVSLDDTGVDVVKEFVTQEKINYPIAIDPDQKLPVVLQTTELPTSVLIDRRGRIVWRDKGAVDPKDPKLTKALDQALAEP